MKRILTILALLGGMNAQALSTQAFVKQLRNTHPFFNQQVLSSQIKQIEKQATSANEDWLIALDGYYKNEDADNITSSSYDKLNTTSAGLSATRKYANTGSNIIFKHTWADRRGENIDSVQNQFSVDYKYPLLRNKNGINDRLSADVAQIAIDKNTLERLEAEESFILAKLERFIDLAYAQERQLINEHRLALAEKELNLVKQKYTASVVEKVDVLLQEDAYQRANQQLLQAQQDLTLLRHEIAITLDLDFAKAVANTNLYQTYDLQVTTLKTYLSNNARVLKINALTQKTLKRQLQSFKNKSKAKLDLSLGVKSTGEHNNYSDSLTKQSPAWKIGLGLSYPLGGVESNSNINKTNIQLLNLKQVRQEQWLNIYTQAKILQEKINLLEKLLQANQKQINIAKARTIEERKRYDDSNGQASFVINAQNNEQSVQLSYAQVAKNYQKTVLKFKATIDQLVK
ncbi:hypothetical protein [uncultured Gammaproteobacteria bacterium]|jgi:outer membrane protein TolC|nr:hypothetical protein [uncultured Gammaproteobacteria bacterium]CAC9560267.1 hypothetical protein [uncultured Gammaproteobacteria bacterium]CAC9573165.1 hypothetical protein [uncultured Gammaproteobacteria bacterium]CAC9578034.1 hypothetical protein [uncultured Gammaproteobacteria bacterium]